MLFVPEENEVVTFMLEGDDKDNPTLYEASPPSAHEAAIAGAMDAARLQREATKTPNASLETIGKNIRRMAETNLMRSAERVRRIINAYPDGREITDPAEILAYIKRLMQSQQRSFEMCMGDGAYLARLTFRRPVVLRSDDGEDHAPPADGEGAEGCGREDIEG